MKKFVFIIFILIILISIKLLFSSNSTMPYITLKGNHIIKINIGEKYHEDGYTAFDKKGGDLTKNVTITKEQFSRIMTLFPLARPRVYYNIYGY